MRKLDYSIEQNDFIGIDQVTGKLYAKMSFDAEDTSFGEYVTLEIKAIERKDGLHPSQPLLQGQYRLLMEFELLLFRLCCGDHIHSRSKRQSTAYNASRW